MSPHSNHDKLVTEDDPMNYDFTTILNREGHDALALDSMPIQGAELKEGFTKIPMWVADMNFPVFPEIQKAISKRLQEPHFGYFELPQAYYDSIIRWQKDRHQMDVKKEQIGYENGVLGCVSSVLQTFTKENDPILVHSPTYIGFTKTLNNNQRTIIHSPLILDENQIWRMDYEDMDKKIKQYHIKVCIFCSPHNPTGRVWEKEEIEKALEVYRNNDCIVISDEIWSDLILPGYTHIPTALVNEDAKQRTVSIFAPSKTFNLAGLVGSYHVIFNQNMRQEILKTEARSHYNSPNILSVHALIGAYSQQGEQWVDELCSVLETNIDFALDALKKMAPEIQISRPQGTYMLYLDCTEWIKNHSIDMDTLLRKGIEVGVLWQDGRPFQKENTIRMNLALPTQKVKVAFERLQTYVLKKS